MTPDDPDQQPADESEHDHVRRLLAAAAEPAPPMPDHVVQRLDDALVGMLAERSGPTPDDNVTSAVTDPSERRPSRLPRLLVAAAAVMVLGLGIGNVMSGSDSDQSSGSASSGEAEGQGDGGMQGKTGPESTRSDAPRDREEPKSGLAPPKKDPAAEQDDSAADGKEARSARLPRLRTKSLTVDAQRVSDFDVADAAQPGRAATYRGCAAPTRSAQGDELIAVRLDGEPATMVLQAPENGHRRVQVYACDDAGPPLASTSIDAR